MDRSSTAKSLLSSTMQPGAILDVVEHGGSSVASESKGGGAVFARVRVNETDDEGSTPSTRSVEGLCQRRHDVYCEGIGPDRVVVRKFEGKTPLVTILSGGGSGHEPSHAGFVGAGLLTAAVAGKVFTSPSREAVLRALQLLSHRPVLVVIKNYTGDRLNFGMAVEAARLRADIRFLVVADDVAISEKSMRRGVAGTVLVHKVAGEAARRGASLQRVYELAQGVADLVRSLGVAFGACHLPSAGGQPSFDIPAGMVEYGVGIHGERGVHIPRPPSLRALVHRLVHRILLEFEHSRLLSVAVLVNNLGGLSNLEMNELGGIVLDLLASYHVRVQCMACGTAMSALDMRGFSVSLLPFYSADDEVFLTDLLCHPVPAVPDWVPFVRRTGARISLSPSHEFLAAMEPPAAHAPLEPRNGYGDEAFDAAPILCRLEAVARSLLRAKEELTELDRVAGDGDLGDSVVCGCRAVLQYTHALLRPDLSSSPSSTSFDVSVRLETQDLEKILDQEQEKNRSAAGEEPIQSLKPLNCATVRMESAAQLLEELSTTVSEAMGGTSGALFGIFLLRMSVFMRSHPDASPVHWVGAVHSGLLAVKEIGGAEVGDRTLVDALQPATDVLLAQILAEPYPDPKTLAAILQDAADAARLGAESTALLNPRKGRAFYLQNILEGLIEDASCSDPTAQCIRSIDGGAMLVSRFLEAFAKCQQLQSLQ